MAATFTWIIEECVRNSSTGGIVEAHWRCNASETVGTGDDAVTYTSTVYGMQRLLPDVDAPDFIPYADVTEADVLGWLWADQVVKADVENDLKADIEDQKAPAQENGRPWIS
jgi:hypothetical protein